MRVENVALKHNYGENGNFDSIYFTKNTTGQFSVHGIIIVEPEIILGTERVSEVFSLMGILQEYFDTQFSCESKFIDPGVFALTFSEEVEGKSKAEKVADDLNKHVLLDSLIEYATTQTGPGTTRLSDDVWSWLKVWGKGDR